HARTTHISKLRFFLTSTGFAEKSKNSRPARCECTRSAPCSLLLFILPKALDFFHHLFGKVLGNLSASSLFRLHHFPYGLYHLRVGQRRDVAHVHEVRDRGN